MNDRDALLRSVLEDPRDDTVRLVYADWLEENGESDWAEFVRSQVAWSVLEKNPVGYCPCDPGGNLSTGKPCWCQWCSTRRRPRELWPTVIQEMETPRGGGLTWITTADWIPADPLTEYGRGVAVVRRGFVDEISLPAAAFTEKIARDLFGRHPVTKVVMTDREPYQDFSMTLGISQCFDWHSTVAPDGTNTAVISRPIFDLMAANRRQHITPMRDDESAIEFPTHAAALAALSDAAVDWGRSLAGLPPLSVDTRTETSVT